MAVKLGDNFEDWNSLFVVKLHALNYCLIGVGFGKIKIVNYFRSNSLLSCTLNFIPNTYETSAFSKVFLRLDTTPDGLGGF
jgi:hypothetical protein